MAGRVIKRLLAGVLTVAVVIPGNFVPAQAAEEPQEDYLIYPNPHKVEYQGRRLHSRKRIECNL
ncbi:hypothetical protein Rumi2_00710 [[Ruminococcus] torques]|uniref:hypothetical protein n=1 Tax=[Ruminococcus] torques TaxID=33039 RepID=UPI0029552214|nr:hypothetical protein [[Ruminococcus] torques]BEI76911.1 hypothetical protein Rumi2_00710 [[Ruminococcus] torques]